MFVPVFYICFAQYHYPKIKCNKYTRKIYEQRKVLIQQDMLIRGKKIKEDIANL